MATRTYSLRWRLILLISIPILISGIMIGGLGFLSSWHEIEEVYDAQLIHSAKVLHQLTKHELKEHEETEIDLLPEPQDWGYKYEKNIAFRIWQGSKLITGSKSAEQFTALTVPPGLSDQIVAGEKWRFFVYIDPVSNITVETADHYAIRYELIEYLMLGLLLPGGSFVLAVLLLVWWGVSRSLRPLTIISEAVDQRHAEDTRSVNIERVPNEIESLVSALNRLLARLGESIRREREFTDNAAHELRTPLAAMKTQAQILRKNLANAPEHSQGLGNLLSSINRATHMVEQLLTFARLQSKDLPRERLNLTTIVDEVVRDLAPVATDKDQELVVEYDKDVEINDNKEALKMMVRNLLDNAIIYTQNHGRVVISIKATPDGGFVSISDNGPGIPEKEIEHVFERFYRGNTVKASGSGLGLSIAKWISDQHGAKLELINNEPGLECRVTFFDKPVVS